MSQMVEDKQAGPLVDDCPIGITPELWAQVKGTKEMVDPFLQSYTAGRAGHNIGLDNGLGRVNNYINGTQRKRYYLIGADSGVGKTTLADYMYVISLYEDCIKKGVDFQIYYCSFEVSMLDKLYKWVACYVWKLFGVQLPSNYIMGGIKDKLVTDEHDAMILKAYSKVLEMCKYIKMMDNILHPTAIFNTMVDIYDKHDGKVLRAPQTEEQKKNKQPGYVSGFVANDKNIYRILILDHLALVGHESGLDTKGLMDRQSQYNMVLRNLFGMTIVALQQFSTDLMSWQRTMKKDARVLIPQRLDFGDSKATYRDADVVFGLVKPLVYDYADFMQYRIIGEPGIDALGGYFIALCLMKNRYGPANKVLPIFLDPIIGVAYDLPLHPTNTMLMQEWYDKALKLDQICKIYSQKDE